MRRLAVALLLSASLGCSSSIPGEAEWVDHLAGKENVAAILERIQDEASAEAALSELEKAVQLQNARYQESVHPGGFSYAQMEAVLQKHTKRHQEIEKRFPTVLATAKAKAPSAAEKLDGFMTQLGYRREAPAAPAPAGPLVPRL